MTSHETNEPTTRRNNKVRLKMVTGLAALVAAAGIGTPLVAHTPRDVPASKTMSEIVADDRSGGPADPALDEYSTFTTDPAPDASKTPPHDGSSTGAAGPSESDDSFAEHGPGGEDPALLASLEIQGDALATGGRMTNIIERASAVWGRFVKLIPAEQRQMVAWFELMDENYEGAHVYPMEEDATRWVLGVAEGLGSNLDATLIHEWGHLMTLKASDVPPNPNASGCKTYFTGEGCALPNSIVARFVEAFWSSDMISESDRISGIYDEDAYFDAMDGFVADHRTEFVTDYAATNPAEDLAETISVFVLTDRPTGNDIKDQKVLFFWNDPSLLVLRDQIRSGL